MKKIVEFVKKRYLLCLSILSLFLLVFIFPLIEKKGTYSLDNQYVTIECPNTVTVGGSVTCTVKLKSTGKKILAVNANYDLNSKVTYKSISMNSASGFELYSVSESQVPSDKGFAIVNLTGVSAQTTLLTVSFDISSSATVGDSYKIGLKNIELVDDTLLSDGSYEMLTADNYSVNVSVVDGTTGDYSINDLTVDEVNKLIIRLDVGTKYSSLRTHFTTSGTVKFLSKSGSELTDTSNVKTGDKVQITVGSNTYTYELSVLGDNTGDGAIDIDDVGRTFKYYNRDPRIVFSKAQIEASDIFADNVIDVNDVGRLYKYYNHDPRVSPLGVGGK